jgi:Zn-dependent protease
VFTDPAPTQFDLNWRMFGIDVRVHPLFWLISAMLGWSLIELGFGVLVMWIVCVFFSILIHELGHVVMGRIFGSDGHIVLYSLGGLAIGSNNLARRWQRILVLLAGPGAQFLLYVPLFWLEGQNLEVLRPRKDNYLFFALQFMLDINWAWPLLNLLPIWPLDGGQISRELLEGGFGQTGTRWAFGISFVVAGFLAIHALVVSFGHTIPVVSEHLPTGRFMALFFAMFALGSFQALQQLHARQRWVEEKRVDPWDDEGDGWRR